MCTRSNMHWTHPVQSVRCLLLIQYSWSMDMVMMDEVALIIANFMVQLYPKFLS